MYRKLAILAFWLVIWYLLALAVDNSILLVTPFAAFRTLLGLLVRVSFWQTVAGSLVRIGAGFLLGLTAALLLAGISFRHPFMEELLHPLMRFAKTVPVAAFVVLFLIWWGSGLLAVAVCFLIVLPNLYINILEGLKNGDRRLLEMAGVFHMPVLNRFFYIYRPALKPFLESGLKLSLGMCWKSGVAAEVIGTPAHSIGGQLYLSKVYLDTAGVLAWTAVVILLSLCFEKLILWLTGLFFVWNPSCKGRIRKKGNTGRITVNKVSKGYDGRTVLDQISAVYEPGGTYYLTGPSGSGKTTLLRLLCGLETPDGGEISGVGSLSMVFQEDRLCEEYSALKNVSMVLGDERKAADALGRLLSEEAIHMPCSRLSGGMKRRVALVRAMEADTDVVLLDEPFTGMDAGTKQAAEEYIREKQNGRTVIIATHIR